MGHSDFISTKTLDKTVLNGAVLSMVLGMCLTLAGCDNKARTTAASLVRVNGQEITASQFDSELMRVAQKADDSTKGQVLESLIDRQLLRGEAVRHHLERDPAVIQAIETARSQILARAYLQSRLVMAGKPSTTEIDDYFHAHPALFSDRKLFDLRQLVMPSSEFGKDLKLAVDSARSLEDVAAWLDGHRIGYVQQRIARSSADLLPEMEKKFRDIPKGQLLVIKEGEDTIVMTIEDIKDSPVNLEAAAPEIERFLMQQKNREMAHAELTRLRGLAKVEYLSSSVPRMAGVRDAAVKMQSADISKDASTKQEGLQVK